MSATVIQFKPKRKLGPPDPLLAGLDPEERKGTIAVVRAHLAALEKAGLIKRKPPRSAVDEAGGPG